MVSVEQVSRNRPVLLDGDLEYVLPSLHDVGGAREFAKECGYARLPIIDSKG